MTDELKDQEAAEKLLTEAMERTKEFLKKRLRETEGGTDAHKRLVDGLLSGTATEMDQIKCACLLASAAPIMAEVAPLKEGEGVLFMIINGRPEPFQLPTGLVKVLKMNSKPVGDGAQEIMEEILKDQAVESFSEEAEEGCNNPFHGHGPKKKATMH